MAGSHAAKLVLDESLSRRVALLNDRVEEPGADRAHDYHERQAHDCQSDQQLDERGTSLRPAPILKQRPQRPRHQRMCAIRPYMGRITDTATKPTAMPTAI